MATAVGVLRGPRGTARREQVRLGARDDTITILLGLWLMAGLFIDGWAHNSRTLVESFFTPWHAILYSGYAASAAWLCGLVLWQRRAGRVGRAAIPRGYELGLAGAFLFGLGGLGDMLWHITFGIETTSLKALLSPTHLLLFVGILLILTSPLRSAWYAPDPVGGRPAFRAFLPPLLSLTAAFSVISFMGVYYWAILDGSYASGFARLYRPQVGAGLGQELGLDGILLTNIVLLAPLLLALRRWLLPFGSITLLFTVNTLLMNALDGFAAREMIPVALLAGLAADLLIGALCPGNARPLALRLFAALVPLLFWCLYFLAGWLVRGIGWPPEIWTGAIVLAVLSGLGLSLLTVPPALPVEEAARSS
jgi:hypothetical protein